MVEAVTGDTEVRLGPLHGGPIRGSKDIEIAVIGPGGGHAQPGERRYRRMSGSYSGNHEPR